MAASADGCANGFWLAAFLVATILRRSSSVGSEWQTTTQLIEHNPRFRTALRRRLKEKTVSVKDAAKML